MRIWHKNTYVCVCIISLLLIHLCFTPNIAAPEEIKEVCSSSEFLIAFLLLQNLQQQMKL